MFTTFVNAFKIKDLRKKILYTLLLIVVYRLGCAIPIPGIDTAAWAKQIEGLALFDFMSLLSGSALSQFTIFAMGISPYITGSIVMQLLAIGQRVRELTHSYTVSQRLAWDSALAASSTVEALVQFHPFLRSGS